MVQSQERSDRLDFDEDPQSLLRDPLRLFQRYDRSKDGKLSMTECKTLFKDLFPTINDEEVRSTFLELDVDGTLYFEYGRNVETLRTELQSFTRCPEKQQFLALMVSSFGETSYAALLSDSKTYDELNRESDSKVGLVMELKDQFLQNVKRRGRQMAFITVYIDDLWRWIEENGIPALHQLNERSNEHINQGIIEVLCSITPSLICEFANLYDFVLDLNVHFE